MHTQSRIPVAVLGATGMVGQRFIELLQGHPWFELVALAASEQHQERPYGKVAKWRLSGSEMPPAAATLPVVACRPEALPVNVKIAFSALPAEVAGEVEANFACAGIAVFSNARHYRIEPDVPLLIPEVNADHADCYCAAAQAAGLAGLHRHECKLLSHAAGNGAQAPPAGLWRA